MSEWDQSTIDKLCALWADGLTASQIGDRMGLTKNAVLGKVHRLNLQRRENPARPREVQAPARQIARALKKTLIRLAAPPVVVVTAPPVVEPPTQFQPRARRACCWPTGEGNGIRFQCSIPALPGKSWCPEHYARVFTTPLTEAERVDAANSYMRRNAA